VAISRRDQPDESEDQVLRRHHEPQVVHEAHARPRVVTRDDMLGVALRPIRTSETAREGLRGEAVSGLWVSEV
jgi:hypothetical protein